MEIIDRFHRLRTGWRWEDSSTASHGARKGE
jgi:hypothetical protein